MKKRFAFLLVFCMVFSLLPTVARAEEAAPETGITVEEIPFQVNPVYSELYTADDFDVPHVEVDPEAAVPMATTYLTTEKAAEQVRKNMKERNETFVVHVVSASSKLQPICDELIELALQHTGKATEGDYLLWQYAGWGASSYKIWNSSTKTYNYDITFTVSYYTTAEQEKEMNTAVTNLINSLGVKYKSDYEKVCAVYDWICANVTYDYDNLEDTTYMLKHTAYAALIDKTAVCQGYAALFYRLMLELGVDNRLIAGLSFDVDGNEVAHGWNIVELDNLYYNVDSTWDAGVEEYSFFLRNEENFFNHYRYMEYATLDFLTTYPMSGNDYVHGEKSEPMDVFFAGQCGDDAYWEIDKDRELTISGTGAIYDYPYSASAQYLPPWHYWEEELYTIVVEEGITVLGDYTFCDQINLKKVTLPSTLKEIRARAFIGCEKLESINIPDGVTYIDGAFEGCGLTSIVIPDSVKDLDLRCFKDCVNLKTVVLGTGLTEIKYATFSNCDSLTSITLPNTLTSIGEEAFYGCDSLKEITIPAGVETMGRESLSGCGKLEKVIFKGKTDLLNGVFSQYNSSMKTVYFYGAAPQFAYNTFMGLTVTCYYPIGSPSWTEEVRQQYGGTVTWVGMKVTCVEHDYEAVVTAPTCQEQGYTTYTCAVCGESYVGDYTDTLDHSYAAVVTDPTCTEQGYTTYTCLGCGESYVGDYTEKLAHSYTAVVTDPTCQAQGFTTYTCSVCGDSYVDDYTDPVDHSYEDGKCIWCGVEDYLVDWVSVNTTLTGSIDLNYYVVLSENLVNADTFVRFTCNGETLDVPMSDAIISVKDGVTRYRFSYKVFAKEMTDVVTAQVMTPDGAVGEAMPYSVSKYCYGIIDYSQNPEMVALCKAMLNYGTAAQNYFGYKLETPANTDLSEEEKAVSDFDASVYAHGKTGSEEGIQVTGAKLLLEADVAIQVSFTLTGSKPIEDYTFTIDGVETDYTRASGAKYYFELDGISASQFDEFHAFSVGGLTLNYSVLSYANQAYNTANASDVLMGLVNAMYAYHTAADAYVN